MKKLILLMAITLVNLIAFSQKNIKNTTTDSAVYLPKNVAREVVKDIIRKDSCEDALKFVVKNNNLLIDNNRLKDSLIFSKDSQISLYKAKEKNYDLMLTYKDQEKQNLEGAITSLKNDLKKTKRKVAKTQIAAGAIVVGLLYLIIK